MNAYQLAYFGLLATVTLFIAIAAIISRKIFSPADFFHDPRPRHNTASLIVANFALGAGVVYILSAGQQHGLLMLTIPLAARGKSRIATH